MKKFFQKLVPVLYLLGVTPALFAQIIPDKMTNLADKIYGAFTSPFVTIILAIMICGTAIAYAFNKDNEKMKRNLIAVAIGCAILLTAKTIVEQVWQAAN